MVRKRTEFDLHTAEDKAHILEGIIVALNNIDSVVALIKKSRSPEEAKQGLIKTFTLSEKQSQAILDMRLQRLTSLEQDKIREEHKGLLALITTLKEILADEQRILNIIKEEVGAIREQYGDERRTEILNVQEDDSTLNMEDLIDPEDNVITFTLTGYIKRTSLDLYREQRRGGKGIIATQTKESDNVKDIFIANTHDTLLAFSNKGKVYWLKTYQIPESSRQARGGSIVNLLAMEEKEYITTFIPIKNFKEGYLLMATKKGIVKKTELSAFSNPRKGGIIALGIDEGDDLVGVVHTSGDDLILLASEKGQAVRFDEKDVRAMGRQVSGVIGIRLHDNDIVIGVVVSPDDLSLLSITQHGYGKRTRLDNYRTTRRGGSGIINIQCTERNGNVVAVRAVADADQIMLISKNGITLRTSADGISEIGRNTQGVRLMKLEEGDVVVSMAKIIDDTEKPKPVPELKERKTPSFIRYEDMISQSDDTVDTDAKQESDEESSTDDEKETS